MSADRRAPIEGGVNEPGRAARQGGAGRPNREPGGAGRPNREPGGAGRLSREQQAWADSSRNRIRRAGHRRGGAREVLIELFAREQCALTVQEIDKRLRGWLQDGVVSRPVGIASVYRGVEVLQDLRLIARVDVGDGVARYERAPLQQHEHHHHHFVCDRCGLLVPFDDEALERAISALESRLGFEAAEHEVVLRGVCVGCR